MSDLKNVKEDALAEINAELKELNRKRRKLIAERRRIMEGRRPRVVDTSGFWVEAIFAIIESTPGISREEIRMKLGSNPQIAEQVFTNTLSVLRRRGWIENRGTRKRPKWYSRGRTPRSKWHTRGSIPS